MRIKFRNIGWRRNAILKELLKRECEKERNEKNKNNYYEEAIISRVSKV